MPGGCRACVPETMRSAPRSEPLVGHWFLSLCSSNAPEHLCATAWPLSLTSLVCQLGTGIGSTIKDYREDLDEVM